ELIFKLTTIFSTLQSLQRTSENAFAFEVKRKGVSDQTYLRLVINALAFSPCSYPYVCQTIKKRPERA
ncbi:hypothetical protein, partial [Phocaeicola plebeius]|uniref:hypothetical protein n=1 Tax=Phocaeicola plebeius TaxID=310297 RepID=UPI001C717A75